MPPQPLTYPSPYLPLFFTAFYILAVTAGAFNGGLWATLGIGGGLLLYAAVWKAEKQRPSLDINLARFTGLALGTVALLNLQSFNPAMSWHILLQETTIMVPLLLLFGGAIPEHVYASKLFPAVTGAAALGALALGLELFLGTPLLHALNAMDPPTRYNRGASYIAVMALPLLGYLWIKGQRLAALVFVLVLLFPFGLTESRATKVAFIVALGTVGLASCWPRMAKWVLAAFLFSTLSMPFLVPKIFLLHHEWLNHLPPSWFNRVEIWDYMSYRIFERPWLGWGIGTSRTIPLESPNIASYIYVKAPPDHPHNVILQLWLELGIPGLVLGFAFALWLLKKAAAFPPALAPFAYGAWMAALCISLVAYNFWNDSLFAMFALTALLLKVLAVSMDIKTSPPAA